MKEKELSTSEIHSLFQKLNDSFKTLSHFFDNSIGTLHHLQAWAARGKAHWEKAEESELKAQMNSVFNEIIIISSDVCSDACEKQHQNHKSYREGITLSIYYGRNESQQGRYWVNFSSGAEKEPFPHGIPFSSNFETREEAADFRDRVAQWLGLASDE
jgi:hypothetical protein